MRHLGSTSIILFVDEMLDGIATNGLQASEIKQIIVAVKMLLSCALL